jgi:hypothetical protein
MLLTLCFGPGDHLYFAAMMRQHGSCISLHTMLHAERWGGQCSVDNVSTCQRVTGHRAISNRSNTACVLLRIMGRFPFAPAFLLHSTIWIMRIAMSWGRDHLSYHETFMQSAGLGRTTARMGLGSLQIL